MRKALLVILLMLCGSFIRVTADEVKVTLKSGMVITGELKEFVPTDHVIVVVAGIETKIPASEILAVEQSDAQKESSGQKQKEEDSNLQYGEYAITETKEYPDSFVLKIAGQELTMILVRGGWFNMGYDDRHSWKWHTEPVHKVHLSSYYVSKQLINRNTVGILLNKKNAIKGHTPYYSVYRDEIDSVIKEIDKISGAPYRLLTEAEWEYLTLMPFATNVFGSKRYVEWCSDFWGDFSEEEQTNPLGPSTGQYYVLRCFSIDSEKWRRANNSRGTIPVAVPYAFVRIAISADSIKF